MPRLAKLDKSNGESVYVNPLTVTYVTSNMTDVVIHFEHQRSVQVAGPILHVTAALDLAISDRQT